MDKHSSPMMQLAKRRAALRLRQLLDEFHLLMGSFPDLHDAFDAGFHYESLAPMPGARRTPVTTASSSTASVPANRRSHGPSARPLPLSNCCPDDLDLRVPVIKELCP